jgi:ABC-type transport system involved in cytochrome bd biosynthesis fused ATPase/permease subunit
MQTIEYQQPRKIETMQEIIARLKKDDPNNRKQKEFQHFVVKEKTEKEIADLEKKYEEARKVLKDVKMDLRNKYDESLNILQDD